MWLSNFKQATSAVPIRMNRASEYQHGFQVLTGHNCSVNFKQEERGGMTRNGFNGFIPYQGLRLGSLYDSANCYSLNRRLLTAILSCC